MLKVYGIIIAFELQNHSIPQLLHAFFRVMTPLQTLIGAVDSGVSRNCPNTAN